MVTALVVTYNRKQLVAECLRALAVQTYPLDQIVLVDNGSTDGTRGYLTEHRLLTPQVLYLRIEVNQGASLGFQRGVQDCYEHGADWVWIMDDDAEPYRDALAMLMVHSQRLPGSSAVMSLVIDRDGHPVPFHSGTLNLRSPWRSLITPIAEDRIKRSDYIEIDHAAFVGLCVRREAIAQAGFPDQRFFIHADDLEYCARLRAWGPIFLVPASVMIHKEAAAAGRYLHRRIGSLESRRFKYDTLWVNYFVRRNSVYFLRQYAHRPLILWMWMLTTFGRSLLGILLLDDCKWRRLRFVVASMVDGFRGTFDNEKPQRLLYSAGMRKVSDS